MDQAFEQWLAEAAQMKHVDLVERFKSLSKEVELGFDAEQAAREVQRCLNCDVQTKFTDKQCIECDACIDVCPVLCLTITPNAEVNSAPPPIPCRPRNTISCTMLVDIPQSAEPRMKIDTPQISTLLRP